MSHSAMDHSKMVHSAGADDKDYCAMHMLFTWDTKNLCIVFKQWHVRSTFGLVITLFAIVLIVAGYEGVREFSRRYESWVAGKHELAPNDESTERTPFLLSGRNQDDINKRAHVVRALLYAFQTFYAFMIMLLFMTYNGWVMAAVAIGAFVGFMAFGGSTTATKETACH